MTDRELLELAAKAAGMNTEWICAEEADYEVEQEGMWLKGDRSPDNSKFWNPLTDDGDALRLAVKLSMRFDCDKLARATVCMVTPMRLATIDHHNDPYAATRRAIVCAAAKIGKSL